jgi:hypothetical protein
MIQFSRQLLFLVELFLLSSILVAVDDVVAFSSGSSTNPRVTSRSITSRETKAIRSKNTDVENMVREQRRQISTSSSSTINNNILATSLALTVATTAALTGTTIQPSNAYVPSDYASDTVQAAVQELTSASGNIDQTFKAYENIAGIITEGKGVGGMVNYSK